MVVYLGADHGGFPLKEKIKAFLKEQAFEVADAGAASLDPADDYPDFAAGVGAGVARDPEAVRGIVICRSGAGVVIAANKFRGVLAVLGITPDQVYNARHDDNVNVLAIASDFTKEDDAINMVRVFLQTPFDKSQERYVRRLDKIAAIENKNFQ